MMMEKRFRSLFMLLFAIHYLKSERMIRFLDHRKQMEATFATPTHNLISIRSDKIS